MVTKAQQRRTDGSDRLELDAFLPYRLSVAQQEVSRTIAQIYAERYELSRNEWRVMAALGCDQPLSARAVCDRTNMDKVQVSRAIARLIRRRLVARHTDPADRRCSSLRLTPRGQRIYREIVPLARAREAALLEAFSAAELRQLDRLVGKLHRRAGELLRSGG